MIFPTIVEYIAALVNDIPSANCLKDGKIILAGLRPDPQRYFDYHHAASDTFDKINKRELELGAAAGILSFKESPL